MTRIERGDVRLITRGGHDWSDRLPKLREALSALRVRDAWLDGEAVVFNAAGRPDLNALQKAFDKRSTVDVILFAFDLLWLNGVVLRAAVTRASREAAEVARRNGKPARAFFCRL